MTSEWLILQCLSDLVIFFNSMTKVRQTSHVFQWQKKNKSEVFDNVSSNLFVWFLVIYQIVVLRSATYASIAFLTD